VIKPIYKQKGSCDDPNNCRGITVLSCFGKLFTSITNNRLVEYFDENTTIGPEQAGFRAGHSTVDHVLPFIVLLTSFWQRKSVRIACLLIMKKHLIVLKECFCGKNFWTLVLTAVY